MTQREQDLPAEWVSVLIDELADVISGGTPKSSDEENFSAAGENIAWLTPADLSGYRDKVIQRGARDLTEKGYNSCSAKLMPKGAILMSSRAPIGYLAIAGNEISTNQGFKNFVFSEGVNSDFAYYYFKYITPYIESLGTGTTFKEVSASAVKKIPFQLAPLAEQKYLADRLDALLGRIQALQERLDRIPAILAQYRQSVLAAAVSGQLTEDWREERNLNPPVSSSIASVASLAIKKKKLDDDLIVSFSSMHMMSERVGEPLKHQEKKWSEVKKGFTFFEDNDVLLAKITPCFENGKTAIARGLINGVGAGSTEFMVLRPSPAVLPEYLLFNITTSDFRQSGAVNMTGSVGHKRVPKEFVESWPILLPTLEEQTEIVRRVEACLARADRVEQHARAAAERVRLLTQAVLAKAFSGELSARWRAQNPALVSGDNSAAALLARIRAQRANQTPSRPRRQRNKA